MSSAEDIARSLGHARKDGNGWKCDCLVHEDRKASLHLSDGGQGLVWNCFAGCDGAAVGQALRERGLLNDKRSNGAAAPAKRQVLKAAQVRKPPARIAMPDCIHHGNLGEPSTTWPYLDKTGALLFVIARYETPGGKQIRPWTWNGTEWSKKAWPAPRPLYGLDRLAAHPQAPVIVVEGEKCAQALQESLGETFCAVTWCGGAEGVKHADWDPLKGRDVTIWPDADEPGKKASAQIAGQIGGAKLLDVGDKPKGWDAADAVAEGWTKSDIETFVEDRARPAEADRAEKDAIDAALGTPKAPKAAKAAKAKNGKGNGADIASLDFARNKDGKIRATLGNVLRAVRCPDICGWRLARDTFRGEIMKAPSGSKAWEPLTDDDYTTLRARLEDMRDAFMPLGLEMTRVCVSLAATENSFDSALLWLEALRWDEVPRVERSLITYFGAENTPYTRAVAIYLWTALAGRIITPGIKADMVPVAVGPQGAMKSSTIAAIAPAASYFAELDMSEDSNDLARRMCGKSVIELAELQGLRSRALEHIKAFIVRPCDEWIPKYKEMQARYDRRCVFFGSTNESEFLADDTGNRRWLPFNCGKCDPAAIARHRDQLWAEGAVLFRKSGIFWKKAEQLARPEHDQFMVTDPWDQLIESWLMLGDRNKGEPFMAADALKFGVDLDPKAAKPADQARVLKILRRLGCQAGAKTERMNGKVGRYWRKKTT